jgi:NAD(P)-dependent dehydrogenase (short-subunit alcohol dehydrogenase family)
MFVNKLVPLLKPGARVLTLSSSGHQVSDVDLDDPNFASTEYQPFIAYGRPKTANILFAVALDRRLRKRGIRATSLHPGGIQTELGRHLTPQLIEQAMARWRNSSGELTLRFKSVPQGAATSVVRLCRPSGGGWWTLLRELQRGRSERRYNLAYRRALLRARSGSCRSALEQE